VIVGESVSVRAYVLACATLLVLTGVTLFLAHVDLHGWNTFVGLGIAAIKAVVIALFFMHLKVAGSTMSRLVAIAALLWLSILLLGTLDDFLTREWLPTLGK
jgi:cytochrome c oxidase subunit 4